MKRTFIVLAILAIAVALLTFSAIDWIPPRILTINRMIGLQTRVLQYAQKHGELPKSLTVLPPRNGFDNSLQDAWGRDITYEVSASGMVTFRSLGRDGAAGGLGENADIIRSYWAYDAQGGWNDPLQVPTEMLRWLGDEINVKPASQPNNSSRSPRYGAALRNAPISSELSSAASPTPKTPQSGAAAPSSTTRTPRTW